MVNILRSDIGEIFKRVDNLYINKIIFSDLNGIQKSAAVDWEHNAESLISALKNHGITIQFYKRKQNQCSFIKQYHNLIKQNEHVLHRNIEIPSFNFSDNFVIMSSDISDKEFFTRSAFSVASSSSPLELKMVSNYVSNSDGMELFLEIGNIFLRARS